MSSGAKWFIWGLIIGLIGAFVPVVGIPFVILGSVMMVYGTFRFFFGAALGTAKGVGKAAGRAAGNKTGTGKL